MSDGTPTSDNRFEESIKRIITEAVRTSRQTTLESVIELCEEFDRTGHDLRCAIRAIKDLKTMLPPPPSGVN